METALAMMLALLAIVPRVPQPQRDRIAMQRDTIATQAADVAERFAVPVVLILVSAFEESHWGTDSLEHSWGAPRDAAHRHIAGGPAQNASSLAMGFRMCHTWLGAMGMFRAGSCRRCGPSETPRVGVCYPHLAGYMPETAMRLAERSMAAAHVPLPPHWR